MYQTLLLVPGQPGRILEHERREEADYVIRNVKAANAYHNGDIVTAVPLNYIDSISGRVHFFLDVGNVPSDKVEVFVGEIAEYLKTRTEEFTKLKG
ncbi:putative uncharacterised protein [Salmonella phage Vi01]|uniref:Uncharacterized protein n=2 Tax=Kuttervirus TaxID=2169536 RepID=E1XT92_BPSAV|nr:putative uncharacterised protein [Salmonella phage Vi01]AGF88568.1 hypothetical protein SP063_00587 [Salmonella phage FSL SP-063]QPX74260.1 hypothetical protein [Salmonella phage FrontPhageNews]UYL83700.1 hypothetical protein GUERRERO_81 [Salmonella phage Guerrero]CBW37951.1 putative uncharacterised protein [Salmonella phage Vi01]